MSKNLKKPSLIDKIRSRTIKIVANALKPVYSLHLKLAPKWRFEIPTVDLASQTPQADKKIPRIIWQTNYSQKGTLSIALLYKFNRLLSPTYEYRFCDDAQCDAFVAQNYKGRIANAYFRLKVGAARADLWRVLVLLKEGGVYLDIDANFMGRPEIFIKPDDELVLIHMINDDITNYFLACAPGNSFMAAVCEQIVDNIEKNELASVFDMTGPTVFQELGKLHGIQSMGYREICTQGQFTAKQFQYVDKPKGHWRDEQEELGVVKSDLET